MILHISTALLDAIRAHAASAPGREVCGLLFGTDERIDAATPAANVHDDPAGHFEIDPGALIAAHRAERAGGPRLVGHYHSHPSGSVAPSAEDIAATESGRLSLIVDHDGALALYRAAGDHFRPVAMIVSNRDTS